MITAERQLRNLLGLEPSDNRLIMPVTDAIEKNVTLDWDKSFATMVNAHPELRRNRDLLRAAERKLASAEAAPMRARTRKLQHLPAENAPTVAEAKRELERQQQLLNQVIHQTTHTLARFHLETETNHKQLEISGRMTKAAQQRLEEERIRYAKNGVSAKSMLKTTSNWAAACIQESRFRCAYNISLMAVREAEGTLLDHNSIVVAENAKAKPDQAVSQAAFQDTPVQQPGFADPTVFEPGFQPPPSRDSPSCVAVVSAEKMTAGQKPGGTIVSIALEGLHSISEKDVRDKLLSRVGEPLSLKVVKTDVKNLRATGWFSDVSVEYANATPENKGRVLFFMLKEKPIIREVKYEGLSKISQKEIEELTKIKDGCRAYWLQAQLAVRQIQSLYAEKGYDSVRVELVEGGNEGDTAHSFSN